jgi:hypothetical protein
MVDQAVGLDGDRLDLLGRSDDGIIHEFHETMVWTWLSLDPLMKPLAEALLSRLEAIA